MQQKSILIIGAGVSGLSAGIYALQQGFKATILENNIIHLASHLLIT